MQVRPRMWPLVVAFLTAIVSMLIANLIMVAVAGAILYKLHGSSNLPDRVGTWALSLSGLAASAGATGIAIAGVAIFGGMLSGQSLSSRLSLQRAQVSWAGIVAAAIATFAAGQCFGAVSDLLGFADVGVLAVMAKSISQASWGAWAISTIGLALIPGVAEELFFRGFMQTRLGERFGKTAAITIAAFLFGLFHMDLKQGIFAFLVGLMLGWFATRAQSIRVSMIAHGASNFFGLVLAKIGAGPESKIGKIALLAISIAIVAAAIAFFARTTRAARDEKISAAIS